MIKSFRIKEEAVPLMSLRLIIFICLISLVAHGQTNKKLALVIGNSKYQNGGILKNPINDAKAIATKLSRLDFNVIYFENLSQAQMKKAIDEFGQKLTGYDVGLFYYAGHGIQSKGRNYIIPIEADIKVEQQIEYDCIAADRVLAFMEAAGTKVNLIFLDACRNNPFERSWNRNSSGSGLAFMNAPTGTLISYATAPGRVASDGDGENGLYTSALLKYIEEPNLSIEQLFKRVRSDVEKQSSKAQIPWESTSLTGDFYFNLVSSNAKIEDTGLAADNINRQPITITNNINKRDYFDDLAIKRGRRDRALIIATSQYDEWSDLGIQGETQDQWGPIFDANSIAYELAQNFGFKVETLFNPNKDALLSKLNSYSGISSLQEKQNDNLNYGENDQLLIYIIGHGLYDKTFDEGFLVTKESKLIDEPRKSYLSFSRLRSLLDNIAVKHLFVVLDVSNGGSLFGARSLRSIPVQVFESPELQQAFAERSLRFRSRVALTTENKSYTSDGVKGRNSPFTSAFLEVVRSNASKLTVITSENIAYLMSLKKSPSINFSVFGDNEPGGEFILQTAHD